MHGRSFSRLASHLPVSGSRHDRDRSGVRHGPFGLRFGRILRGRREAAVKRLRPPNVLARERSALAVLKRRARSERAGVRRGAAPAGPRRQGPCGPAGNSRATSGQLASGAFAGFREDLVDRRGLRNARDALPHPQHVGHDSWVDWRCDATVAVHHARQFIHAAISTTKSVHVRLVPLTMRTGSRAPVWPVPSWCLNRVRFVNPHRTISR